MQKCTLCEGSYLKEIVLERDPRRYFLCKECFLIFAHSDFHLNKEEEKSRYSNHQNRIDQAGYVKFLNRAIFPSLDFISSGMIGLDYGCGPSPTLSKLLLKEGIECFDYDPIFGFDHPLDDYDFIFATECFEHFFLPKEDLQKINSLLKPHGFLSIMTERWVTEEGFKDWYYKNDPTHVSFFHENTFHYISKELNFDIVYQDENRVVILKRNNINQEGHMNGHFRFSDKSSNI